MEFFGKLAEEYSIEPASRANQGRVPPIRQFGGQPELQDEVFKNLKPGQISGIIQLGDKFVIVYLENFTKPIDISLAEARNFIYEDVHEKKLRLQMANTFDRIKEDAWIDNYLTGTSQTPKQRQVVSGARQVAGNTLRRIKMQIPILPCLPRFKRPDCSIAKVRPIHRSARVPLELRSLRSPQWLSLVRADRRRCFAI